MTEEINYYEILSELGNLLYKIQVYNPLENKTGEWFATQANKLRLDVLHYIFSIPLLKNEFIDKVNKYIEERKTPDYKEEVERFKNKVLELYYNDNSVSQRLLANKIENLAHEAFTQPLENMQKLVNELSASINVDIELLKTETENAKIDEIDDFLCDCVPEIFYYPKVATEENNYILCESIVWLYAFNEELYQNLKTEYLINIPLEYYVITKNYPLYAENPDTLFCESYMMTALCKVIDDLYSFVDKECRKIYTGRIMKLDTLDQKLKTLTPRQKAVCKEIVKGNSVINISTTLNMEETTVRAHITQACVRLSLDGSAGIKTLKKYLDML